MRLLHGLAISIRHVVGVGATHVIENGGVLIAVGSITLPRIRVRGPTQGAILQVEGVAAFPVRVDGNRAVAQVRTRAI